MPTCPTTNAQYTEEIKTITFRADDGITIPKSVREEAFELAIDVIIRSIPRDVYKNYECTPAEAFYGNATIVKQDCLELKIPLKFPRQRIYYGRVEEAFVMWNELVNFEYHRSMYLDLICGTVVNLGVALGLGVTPPSLCCSLPQPVWRELPIKEVYVNVPFGTQYEIEVSWLRPTTGITDLCGSYFDGKSGQNDGDKGDGLPQNGIFPNIASNSSTPFVGLPPATTDFEQGGFSNSKIANTNDVDPSNIASTSQSCAVTWSVPFLPASGTVTISGLPLDVTFQVEQRTFPGLGTTLYYGIKATNGAGNSNTLGWFDGSSTLNPEPTSWSQAPTFVTAVCTLE